jgi:hypothetical protein
LQPNEFLSKPLTERIFYFTAMEREIEYETKKIEVLAQVLGGVKK